VVSLNAYVICCSCSSVSVAYPSFGLSSILNVVVNVVTSSTSDGISQSVKLPCIYLALYLPCSSFSAFKSISQHSNFSSLITDFSSISFNSSLVDTASSSSSHSKPPPITIPPSFVCWMSCSLSYLSVCVTCKASFDAFFIFVSANLLNINIFSLPIIACCIILSPL